MSRSLPWIGLGTRGRVSSTVAVRSLLDAGGKNPSLSLCSIEPACSRQALPPKSAYTMRCRLALVLSETLRCAGDVGGHLDGSLLAARLSIIWSHFSPCIRLGAVNS